MPRRKDQRFILVHSGGVVGLVGGAALSFTSKTNSAD